MARLLNQVTANATPLMEADESLVYVTGGYRKGQRAMMRDFGGFFRTNEAEKRMQREGSPDGLPPFMRLVIAVTTNKLMVWGDRGWLFHKITGAPLTIPGGEIDGISIGSDFGPFKSVSIRLKDGKTLDFEMGPQAAAGLRAGLTRMADLP